MTSSQQADTNMPSRATDVLAREEIRRLTEASDLRGWLAVFGTWLLIGATLAWVAWWPHPVSIALAMLLLGGRHLALAVLVHEASHRSLFRSRWLNDTIGHWLCAAPAWQRLGDYRTHHMAHHAHTNTDKDTDLSLIARFPVTKRSLLRKFARDIIGITGVKRVYGLLLMDLGIIEYTASTDIKQIDQKGRRPWHIARTLANNITPPLLANGLFFGILYAAGIGWVYLLWIASYLTTFSLFLRIRSIAEHACTSESTNPFENTRTTYANWLERLTVAPMHVNYHLEHHLLMTVPHYKLPEMHELLRERGVYKSAPLANGYLHVLTQVLRDAPA